MSAMRFVTRTFLFGVLLTGACKHEWTEPSSPDLPDFCACLPGSQKTSHYKLMTQQQPSGLAWLTLCDCSSPAGHRLLRGERRISFSRAGSRVNLLTRFAHQLNAQGEAVRLQIQKGQDDVEPSVSEAARIGSEMLIRRQGQDHQIPWEKGALEEDSFTLYLASSLGKLEPKEKIEVRIFSLSHGEYSDWGIELLERAPDGSSLILVHPGTMPGLEVRQRIDPEGQPVESLATMGRLILRSERTGGGAAKIPDAVPELSALSKARTTGSIAAPGQLVLARYRLKGLPKNFPLEQLRGPGQRILSAEPSAPIDIEVRRLSEPSSEGPPQKADPRYLQDSPMLGLADPDIQNLAGRLSSGHARPWTRAKKIRDWTSENIESDMTMNYLPAPAVLRAGRGDCTEKSMLLVALARAAGIPARVVGGLIYHEGFFAGHMWTEVWTEDGWRPLDAAYGDGVVSAARIRLEEPDLSPRSPNRASLAGKALVLGLRVEILETSEQKKPAAAVTSSSP